MEQNYMRNEMMLEFDAVSSNESLARVSVAACVAALDPTLEEMNDIKTAVSEAVTNSIIHGYENWFGYGIHNEMQAGYIKKNPGKVKIRCSLSENQLEIEVEDSGKGIDDVEKAMEPLYTSKPQLERSGMGFAFMEAFMDELEVESKPGQGTLVRMKKKMGNTARIGEE